MQLHLDLQECSARKSRLCLQGDLCVFDAPLQGIRLRTPARTGGGGGSGQAHPHLGAPRASGGVRWHGGAYRTVTPPPRGSRRAGGGRPESRTMWE